MKKYLPFMLSALLVVLLSSCGIANIFKVEKFPSKALGARAFIKGRIMDANGEPIPGALIMNILKDPHSYDQSMVYNNYVYDYLWFVAFADSLGKFSGLAFSEIRNDSGLTRGCNLGKAEMRFVALDKKRHTSRGIIFLVNFEYDSLHPYAYEYGNTFNKMYKADSSLAGKFPQNDFGDIVLKKEEEGQKQLETETHY